MTWDKSSHMMSQNGRISSTAGVRSGTIQDQAPAALAARMPFRLSSNIRHCFGGVCNFSAAVRKISGSGLPFLTSSPHTEAAIYVVTPAMSQ